MKQANLCAGTQHLGTFLFCECRANHGHQGFESIKVTGHSLEQVLEYCTAFLEV